MLHDPASRRRFWVNHALLPLLAWCLLTGLFELGNWDLALSDPFYNPARGGWFLKQNWWTATVLHRGGRNLIAAIGAGALLAWGWSCVRRTGHRWRRAALFLALCIVLGTGLTALGKAVINSHSPWDYARYGGAVPYVKLFKPAPAGFPEGHSFPAGHAAGGFALTGSYFIFYRSNRRLAWAGLSVGLLTGGLFAWGQQLRGALFASHNRWTMLICWAVALGLYAGVFRGRLLGLDRVAGPARSQSPRAGRGRKAVASSATPLSAAATK